MVVIFKMFIKELIIFTLFVFQAIQGLPQLNHYGSKIVGGQDVDITQAPYMVQIEAIGTNALLCGGSILTKQFILTSALCTYGYPTSDFQVRYGTNLLGEEGVVVLLNDKIEHPNFSPELFGDNLAILRLETDIVFSDSAQPIPLASADPKEGDVGIVSGWGWPSVETGAPQQLYSVNVTIMNHDECEGAYTSDIVTDRMECTVNDGKGFCDYDYGGPLVINGVQSGIVTFGFCNVINLPDMYTNVAPYREFIESVINNSTLWA